ncbi:MULTISPECIES: rubredoxin [Dehalococcoides]|uniref:Rubredoxin n=1 Tax=Dehalococcoides mccartyi TaxID=61435 RepID=A0AB33HS01_9CHLR|nr:MULTISPECIES: rubredoxin [Dehalococcoides]WRX71605.1 rubredoxin [Dehalococcoides mccartyi]BAS32372.1 rubredoxin [Dehalococcoides mccartyi IBARAKI]BAZ97900.1 rubredoxin [Dehalococcoides mccartyi]
MKRGERHKDREKIKKYVVHLGSQDPRDDNKVICYKVEQEFGVSISDTTVRRYCIEAGVPTSSRKSYEKKDKIEICKASPEHLDTLMLTKWGVPDEVAPDILGDWRKHHERGEHEICNVYGKLRRNLVDREIPYEKAEALLKYEKRILEFDDTEARTNIEIMEAMRPWDGNTNEKLYWEEIRRRNKSTWEDMENSYECGFCEKRYSPMEGDSSQGIEPNTPFEDLPDSWACPACSRGKEQFKRMGE